MELCTLSKIYIIRLKNKIEKNQEKEILRSKNLTNPYPPAERVVWASSRATLWVTCLHSS